MSCLFRSLARFTAENNEVLLRQRICNYLMLDLPISNCKSSEYIAWESNFDLDTYVDRMRQPQVWGGAIEIQTFCEMYNCVVIVRSIRGKDVELSKPMTFMPTQKQPGLSKCIELSWNGGHYEPVSETFHY